MNDGSLNGTHTAEAFSDVNGKWTLTPDSTSSESGMFAVEIKNTTTGETEWRRPDIQIQLENLVGADGNAPIADGSVVVGKLATNAVSTIKIVDSAVTDPKIGNRTIAESAPISDTGTLTNLLNYLAYQVAAIMGEVDWKTTPDSDIATLAAGGGGGGDLTYLTDTLGADTQFTSTGSFGTISGIEVSLTAGTWLCLANIIVDARYPSPGTLFARYIKNSIAQSTTEVRQMIGPSDDDDGFTTVTLISVLTAAGAETLGVQGRIVGVASPYVNIMSNSSITTVKLTS